MNLSYIFAQKCPRCHQGDLFQVKNPFNFRSFAKMHEHCPACGQKTEPEPGFYYGAMYVSYGLSVGIFLVNFFVFAILFPLPGWSFIILNTILLLFLWPLIFRLARTIYLSLFVCFDPKAGSKRAASKPNKN